MQIKLKIIMAKDMYWNLIKAKCEATSKVIDYINGMWTEPKYFAVRMFFQVLVPDISIVMFAILSRLHVGGMM